MDSPTALLLAWGLLTLVPVGLGYLVNLIARRPLVNPWFLGMGALALLGAGNAWLVIRSGLLNTADPSLQGERFGEHVAGPVFLPLLLLLWQARRFRRREAEAGAAKGSFVGALGITAAFAVVMALVIAVSGPFIRRASETDRKGASSGAGPSRRSAALAKVAAEMSRTLPTVVDEETELFGVTADGDMLAYDYRMVNTLKRDLSAEAVETFRAGIIKHACGTSTTREQFLRQGVVLRHRYHDKVKELITSIEIAWKDCA